MCSWLYQTLCADVEPSFSEESSRANQETTLESAFRVLCSHYEGDPLQASICARVLAFYFLMERTAGAAVAAWVHSVPDAPQLVALHPAVVEAIAKIRIRGTVLSDRSFEQVLTEAAAGKHPQPE